MLVQFLAPLVPPLNVNPVMRVFPVFLVIHTNMIGLAVVPFDAMPSVMTVESIPAPWRVIAVPHGQRTRPGAVSSRNDNGIPVVRGVDGRTHVIRLQLAACIVAAAASAAAAAMAQKTVTAMKFADFMDLSLLLNASRPGYGENPTEPVQSTTA